MKQHFPISQFADGSGGAPAAAKAYEELERRIGNVHAHAPTTSVELDYTTDAAVPTVRITVFGTPADVLAYFVARARTNGKGDT